MMGGVNWGIVGLFNFDIISYAFGADSILCRLTYILIGACAAFSATYAVIDCKCHCEFFECNNQNPAEEHSQQQDN